MQKKILFWDSLLLLFFSCSTLIIILLNKSAIHYLNFRSMNDVDDKFDMHICHFSLAFIILYLLRSLLYLAYLLSSLLALSLLTVDIIHMFHSLYWNYNMGWLSFCFIFIYQKHYIQAQAYTTVVRFYVKFITWTNKNKNKNNKNYLHFISLAILRLQ